MNKKRLFCLVVAPLLMVSLVMTGCGPEEPGVIKVGMAMTLSGPAAKTGEEVADGVRIAVKHWNDLGGVTVDGRKYLIELIEYDTAMKPEQAASATRKLIEQDQVLVMFGDCISTAALAQKPVIEKAGVPWITMGSHPDLTKDRKYTFRSNHIARRVYETIAKIAIQEYDLTKCSLLDAEDAFSQDVKAAMKECIPEWGGTILTDDSFPPGHMDFYSILTRIKAAGPDIVFSQPSDDAPTILKQAHEVGLEVQWLFGNQTDAKKLVEQAGELAAGVWQAINFESGWDKPSVKTFVGEAEALLDQAPILTNALGYEGAMRMFMAIEKANSLDREEIVEALYQVDWDGVFFIGKYDETGNATSSVQLMAVTADGTYEKIKELY